MIAWNKGQTVTWSRGHVMDRFRPGQAPRRPATAFNPDRPRNRPTDRQTTRINQPDRPDHRQPRRPPPPAVPSSSNSSLPLHSPPFFRPSSSSQRRVPFCLRSPPLDSWNFRKISGKFRTGSHGPPRLNNVNHVILNLDTRRPLSGKTALTTIDNDLIRSDVASLPRVSRNSEF